VNSGEKGKAPDRIIAFQPLADKSTCLARYASMYRRHAGLAAGAPTTRSNFFICEVPAKQHGHGDYDRVRDAAIAGIRAGCGKRLTG
jgi:hypothetical protein